MHQLRFALTTLVTVAILLCGARFAAAREVYLNGARLSSTTKVPVQLFSGCDVTFDENGDVHIDAKGYKISIVEDTPPPKPGVAPTPVAAPVPVAAPRRFFITTQESTRGLAQYDFDILMNGQMLKHVAAGEDPQAIEITPKVLTGKNLVKIIATKNVGAKRLSTSPEDTAEVTVGAGTSMPDGRIMIDRTVLHMLRTGAEIDTFSGDAEFDVAATTK